MNKSEPIPVELDTLLDFLEKEYSDPQERWQELRHLLQLQKDAQQRAALDKLVETRFALGL
jgi:hypothetical protein